VQHAYFLVELKAEPAQSQSSYLPSAVVKSDLKSLGELETWVWTRNSNEQPQWLRSGFLNYKVGYVRKEEETNATDSRGKEQVKTVAHAALEETETGCISPPRSSKTTCNY